jgi:N-acetyl-alpha-D-glucosaminyl L-malate synthase BshA
VLDCIRVLAEVRQHIDARLLMVGDGPECGPAERLAHSLGVGRHVDFLGKRQHVEELIPLADVLLMPSEMESFGLAALEAMACGVPVVATRVGGVPELITHGVDGFLEKVGDIGGMAARVTELLSAAVLHERMASAARATAMGRFSADQLVPQYVRYYEQVLNR